MLQLYVTRFTLYINMLTLIIDRPIENHCTLRSFFLFGITFFFSEIVYLACRLVWDNVDYMSRLSRSLHSAD